MQEEFGFNNPFERNSVGEEEIWAEGEEGFQDVEIINQSAFKILLVGEFIHALQKVNCDLKEA